MRDLTREQLQKNAIAAKSLIAELASDDDDLNHDMIEGETGLFEAVQVALDEIGECEIIAAGCDDQIGKLRQRKDRADKRATRLRGLIDQAFQMAEVKAHTFPTATITTKRTPPKLIISDEAAIPSRFFEPQPPKLNKKALLDAIKAGEAIQGASKSNGGTTIQIRKA